MNMQVDGIPIATTGGYCGPTPYEANDAAAVLTILMDTYPGHAWHVRTQGGLFYIRHIVDGMVKPWGMVVKFKDVTHDWKVLKHEVIIKAGEWLERAGLARRASDGTEATYIEGLPDSHQPVIPQKKEPVILASDGMPARQELRPQAILESDNG